MTAQRAIELIAVWVSTIVTMSVLVWLAARGLPYGLVQNAGLLLIGALIVTSRHGNRIGLLMVIGAVANVPNLTLEVAGFAERLPVGLELLFGLLGALSSLVLALAVLMYPTGRITTRGGRILAAILAVIAVATLVLTALDPLPLFNSGRANPLGVDALRPLMGGRDGTPGVVDFLWLAGIGVAVAALIELVARWRRSEGPERLQFRWFAFGILIVLVGLAVAIVGAFHPLSLLVYAASINAIPITIGIAITRHGLYEINRVISRTAAYALVTALALGVYAIVVTSVTWILPGASSIAVAGATLAAAALALPALRRVRALLDRHFDRERYDAQKVVDAFGERLRTRVDPARTRSDLRDAVDRTLAPSAIGVWTRGPGSTDTASAGAEQARITAGRRSPRP